MKCPIAQTQESYFRKIGSNEGRHRPLASIWTEARRTLGPSAPAATSADGKSLEPRPIVVIFDAVPCSVCKFNNQTNKQDIDVGSHYIIYHFGNSMVVMHTSFTNLTPLCHICWRVCSPTVTYDWFPVILCKWWRVPHVGQEMLTLSGTSDLTPFREFMISPIHYICNGYRIWIN